MIKRHPVESGSEIPDWFDDQLRDDLHRKIHRKRGPLSFVDVAAYSVLDRVIGKPTWRFKDAYGWPELEEYITEDCRAIRQSGFRPDVILGVKSGGAFIANYVARCLETKQVEYINVDRYTPIFGSAFVAFLCRYFRAARLTIRSAVDLSRRKVLIVDDQVITGKSLQAARNWAEKNGASEVKTYCIFTQRAETDFGNRSGIMMKSPWGDDP